MTIVKRQIELHHAVSAIGGFFGGYTVLNHTDILANAQTGNLIKLVCNACSGDLKSVGFMILMFFVYAAGNAFYAIARKYLKISMKIVSFIVMAVGIILVGALSNVGNHYVSVLPIVFLAPVQWNAFKTAGGNSSATIFSSNNVRQAVIQLTNYFMNKDKAALRKARFYWATLLCFHLGLLLSCLLTMAFGVHSVWFCYILLAIAVFTYYRYQTAKINAFFNSRT